jgi:predicted RNase H-like HicB family nuclease
MNRERFFTVIVEADETGGYVVTNPALEGCYSQGDTLEEALENIKEATELCLEDLEENREKRIRNLSLHLIRVDYA